MDPTAVFRAIFRYPGTHGHRDFTNEMSALHAQKQSASFRRSVALALLKDPNDEADIAVGSTQRFRGVPEGYGGPLVYGNERCLNVHARSDCGHFNRQPKTKPSPIASNPRTAYSPRKATSNVYRPAPH